ncbi:MAG: phospho-sugar mutase [Oscillospiraceae bacterium]|jgi:phosphoglucomutase|nr:phospho-sugar mutase [Oscillospiraceae bacterium]
MTTEEIRRKYEEWRTHCKDPDLLSELEAIGEDGHELRDRFSKELEFGTGGVRGLLGVGPNRVNRYTIRRITTAFALFLNAQAPNEPSVVIGYDSRKASKLLADEAATVLATNGFKVLMFPEIIPTPVVSFAVRNLCCTGGIMITASHNPATYNGIKVYGKTGTQLCDKDTTTISEIAKKLDFFVDLKSSTNAEITPVPTSLLDTYFETIKAALSLREIEDFNLVFTPLNGAGSKPIKRLFGEMNLKSFWVVPEQEEPDPEFKTCEYPNPEDKNALKYAIKLAKEKNAQLVIATDPDCDRIGVAEKNGDSYYLLSGNDLGVLLLDYLCRIKNTGKSLTGWHIIKSIVTTNMVEAIAEKYGLTVNLTLTGFKNICGKMDELEATNNLGNFVIGFEESCGYLPGTYARDKDGISTTAVVCEMVAEYNKTGTTLLNRLNELYEEFGFYMSFATCFEFKGTNSMELMGNIMQKLRSENPSDLANHKISSIQDYKKEGVSQTNDGSRTGFPTSDVLVFNLSNRTQVVMRPSGTEPKLKLYYLITASSKDDAISQFEALRLCMDKKIREI